VVLSEEVEADEVYIVAGHKGHPEVVRGLGRRGRRRRLKGARGRGTLAGEKPPVLGLIQRGGEVLIRMLPNVQQVTIKPVITSTVRPGTTMFTDEYDIYHRLPEWGYPHETVNHSAGEYARDDDGDGFHEVHVNTMEGFWSLLRSWLRPHRGISQERLPLYLGFFEFVHNVRRRGKALLAGSTCSSSKRILSHRKYRHSLSRFGIAIRGIISGQILTDVRWGRCPGWRQRRWVAGSASRAAVRR